MVTAAGMTHAALRAVFGTIEIVVIIGWVALFAILIGYLAVITVSRSKGKRARELTPAPPPDLAAVQAGLEELRGTDTAFDELLLIDAAHTVALLVFAALSVGDDAPLRRVTGPPFWLTPFGRLVRSTAAERRRLNAEEAKDTAAAGRKRAQLPVDYQATAPELAAVLDGPRQAVSIRVSFSQLQAVIESAASRVTAAAAAPNLGAMAGSLAGAVASRMDGQETPSVSWLSGSGCYDLTFERPAGSRTDPLAALASRTCPRCGGGYRSEFEVACSYCQAPRPLPWGDWRLIDAAPIT